MIRKARCCCGQLSVEVEGEPKYHLVCHCENCKHRTGSAFGISAYFYNSKVMGVTGEAVLYRIENESTEQQRFFCKTCGTTLYWKISRLPGFAGVSKLTGVAGGCFDEQLPPGISANEDNKCAWLDLKLHQTEA